MYNAEEEDNRPQKTTPEPDPAVTTPTGSNAEKDPDEWITGSEVMTGAQKSYLKTLSDEAGEEFRLRRSAGRAFGGARLRRSHAERDHGSVWRICE